MFLKRLILVNWGNIPKIELEFGPVNLFSGGNGSGKTTAADAIQALMTAAHENLFAFNPGQDETTQKGRGGKQVRTLASYLMGCDDGSFARLDDTDGYVAGVFHPTSGEASEVFTAVMALRGHVEKSGQVKQARLDDVFFMILPGEELHLTHFIAEAEGEKHLTAVTKIQAELKKIGNLEYYDKKGAYLRRLYGALRGKKDSVTDREAKHAARTFAGFMAYKPVKSIHEFVAQEILEPRDLGEAIRSVSDLMKTIGSMEANAASIKASIDTLDEARNLAARYVQLWLDQQTLHYTEACRQSWVNQQLYITAKNQQSANRQLIAECEQRSAIAAERKQHILARMVQLQAQRQGIQQLRDKDALTQRIAHLQKKLTDNAAPLQTQLAQLKNNLRACQDLQDYLAQHPLSAEIPALDKPQFLQQCKAVSHNKAAHEVDFQRLINRDWVGVQPMENQLDQLLSIQSQQNLWVDSFDLRAPSGLGSLREQVRQLLEQRQQARDKCAADIRRLTHEINLRNNQHLNYPHYVEQALRTLQEQLPQADAKVLCDYVDVSEEHWQMAIEGYIGGARFSIIVERDYEAEAIRILRNMKGDKRNNARVIQGAKAAKDADRLSLPKHSILEVMQFSHATAEAYIKASYGSVLRVDSAEALRNTARGITAEGMGSGNYSLWRCDLDDAELVFGKGARLRALKAKEKELDKTQVLYAQTEKQRQDAELLGQIVERIRHLDVAQVMHNLMDATRELQEAERQLQQLDVGQGHEWDTQLQQCQNEFAEHEQQSRLYEQEMGRLLEKQKQDDKAVEAAGAEQERLILQQEAMEQLVLQAASLYPRLDAEAALQQAESRAQASSSVTEFVDALRVQQDSLAKTERHLFEAIQRHNMTAALADKLAYDTSYCTPHSAEFFKQLVNLGGEIEQLHNRLKNNILVEKHRQLVQLKDSFNTAFVSNLCHSIYQAINEGKRILEELNKELQHHRFGADRETFYFDMEWVPEYQEYWQFFKTLINLPNLGEGSTLFDVELPPKFARTRDQLLSMLLDNDEQTAHRELARISDYRNYRRYEIYKQPENKNPIALSQYGTGSGGQLETPAYIIRSAAVTSAFRFNEGKSHMRMVMVDEAFSKMDEGRSREVIRYLTESLGLQLLFIMPTSKSGPFLDIISNQFVFTKCPTQEPVGELQTRVLVDRKTCNSEHIKHLWAHHRKTIRHQAMLDFMEDI
jgi:energy-coupling factor transporter ATP-binding protein EcfA2